MEEGVLHRQLCGSGSAGLRHPHRRAVEVIQRLGDTVEHQADPHPGGKHHRHPGELGELRHSVVGAQFDVAVPAQRQVGGENHECPTGQDEQPAKRPRHPGHGLTGEITHFLRRDHAPEHEGDREGGGHREDDAVHRKAGSMSHLAVRDVVIGLGHAAGNGEPPPSLSPVLLRITQSLAQYATTHRSIIDPQRRRVKTWLVHDHELVT